MKIKILKKNKNKNNILPDITIVDLDSTLKSNNTT